MEFLTPTLGLMHALHIAALQSLALLFSALGSEPFYLLLLPLVFWFYDRRIGGAVGRAGANLGFRQRLGEVGRPSAAPLLGRAVPSRRISKRRLNRRLAFHQATRRAPFWCGRFWRCGRAIRRNGCRSRSDWRLSLLSRGWCWAFTGPSMSRAARSSGPGCCFSSCGSERRSKPRSARVQSWCKPCSPPCSWEFLAAPRRAVFGSRRRCARCLCARLGRRRSLARRAGCGTALDCFSGLLWAPRDVPIRRSIARGALGFAGVALFYFGLSKASHVALPLAFARYFLTTFWVSCGRAVGVSCG